jgi:hypothetical protein
VRRRSAAGYRYGSFLTVLLLALGVAGLATIAGASSARADAVILLPDRGQLQGYDGTHDRFWSKAGTRLSVSDRQGAVLWDETSSTIAGAFLDLKANRAYVRRLDSRLDVRDLTSFALLRTIDLPVTACGELAPLAGRVWFYEHCSGNDLAQTLLGSVDPATGTVVTTAAPEQHLTGLAALPGTVPRLLLTGVATYVVDTTADGSARTAGTAPVVAVNQGLAASPDGTRLYTGTRGGVEVLRVPDLAVLRTTSIPGETAQIGVGAINESGTRLVLDYGFATGTSYVLDTSTLVATPHPLPYVPNGAVEFLQDQLVVDRADGSLAVEDGTPPVVITMAVGDFPCGATPPEGPGQADSFQVSLETGSGLPPGGLVQVTRSGPDGIRRLSDTAVNGGPNVCVADRLVTRGRYAYTFHYVGDAHYAPQNAYATASYVPETMPAVAQDVDNVVEDAPLHLLFGVDHSAATAQLDQLDEEGNLQRQFPTLPGGEVVSVSADGRHVYVQARRTADPTYLDVDVLAGVAVLKTLPGAACPTTFAITGATAWFLSGCLDPSGGDRPPATLDSVDLEGTAPPVVWPGVLPDVSPGDDVALTVAPSDPNHLLLAVHREYGTPPDLDQVIELTDGRPSSRALRTTLVGDYVSPTSDRALATGLMACSAPYEGGLGVCDDDLRPLLSLQGPVADASDDGSRLLARVPYGDDMYGHPAESVLDPRTGESLADMRDYNAARQWLLSRDGTRAWRFDYQSVTAYDVAPVTHLHLRLTLPGVLQRLLGATLGVDVTDDNGQPVQGVSVALSLTDGSGRRGIAAVTTDAAGHAPAAVTGQLTGALTVTATVGGSVGVAGEQAVATASVVDPARDPVGDYYRQMGGAASYLGAPVGAAATLAGGQMQAYAGGAIYWSAATGAHAVKGAILARYQALGGPSGVLGFPTTDEQPTGPGRVSHFTGRGAGAAVYWTLATGAQSVRGAILAHYTALGGPTGVLGFPTTDELGTPEGVGRFNHFTGNGAGASVYWTPATGAWSVRGAIRAHWAALGWETGPLGYPTIDELGTPDGAGRFNHFTGNDRTGASIYWTPATGAWSIHGAIRAAWAAQGWETGPLGYPTTDEYAVPDGRRNDLTGGSLTYSYATGRVTTTYR